MEMIHPLTLAFYNNELEKTFKESTFKRTRQQGLTAILIGMFVYVLCGWMDRWFVPTADAEAVWVIRFLALSVPTAALILSLTPLFERYVHAILALVGLAAGIGLISIQVLLPLDSTHYYYPLMVLVTFYTYNFVGTRFLFALFVDLSLLIAYNVVFGIIMEYPIHVLLAHDVIIVSANLIGGAAGYLSERQRRTLFIRERELEDERQRQMQRALHDPLTGLPNRDLLYDRITHSMVESRRQKSTHCGYFLDLDGFKTINDTLGHQVGDRVLKYVAKLLVATVRETDTVARIGGDEFFILAHNVNSQEDAIHLAQKILDQLALPIPELPEGIVLSASIGLCLFPYQEMSITDIIRRADEAMYQVKTHGKGNYLIAGSL